MTHLDTGPIRISVRHVSRFIAGAAMSLGLLAPVLIFAQQKPVSWVNPKLPEGRGLTHHVLPSNAMGHEVGFVVWTPQNYDASGTIRYPVLSITSAPERA